MSNIPHETHKTMVESANFVLDVCVDVELSDSVDEENFRKGLDALSDIVNYYNETHVENGADGPAIEKARRGLELLENIIAPEEENFEEFQDGMEALQAIVDIQDFMVKHAKSINNLFLTDGQHNDLQRIMENEKRIQEEDGDERSPMVVLFYGNGNGSDDA